MMNKNMNRGEWGLGERRLPLLVAFHFQLDIFQCLSALFKLHLPWGLQRGRGRGTWIVGGSTGCSHLWAIRAESSRSRSRNRVPLAGFGNPKNATQIALFWHDTQAERDRQQRSRGIGRERKIKGEREREKLSLRWRKCLGQPSVWRLLLIKCWQATTTISQLHFNKLGNADTLYGVSTLPTFLLGCSLLSTASSLFPALV